MNLFKSASSFGKHGACATRILLSCYSVILSTGNKKTKAIKSFSNRQRKSLTETHRNLAFPRLQIENVDVDYGINDAAIGSDTLG